jgi:hypothetical protein
MLAVFVVRPIRNDVDVEAIEILGFSFSWELDYVNILAALKKFEIPIDTCDLANEHPLVFGGGPVLTANPEPFAAWFDIVLLGDGEELIGCVTYGTPPSSNLRTGIAGKEKQQLVLELNRLVLKYNEKNQASFLVSKSLKLLPSGLIIVSFADIEQNHKGIVYQACNFGYYGLSAKRTDWKVKGKEHLHGISVADEFRGKPNRAQLMRDKYGDDFYLAPRSRKHRYIYITGNGKDKKRLEPMIKYERQMYV